MKLNADERRRISNGDVKFLKEVLLSESKGLQENLLVFKESKGLDDWIKGKCAFIQELLKVLEG